MHYNFDTPVSREDTYAMSLEGFRDYLFTKDDILELPCVDQELIMMWVADMAFATAPEIIKAIKERADHGIFGYSKLHDEGYKAAFIDWAISRYGYAFKNDHIVTSPGIVHALFELISYCCAPDEKVLIMTPSYAFFKHAADAKGITVVTTDLIEKEGRFEVDFEDLKAKVEDKKVTLSVLCNPHNPTGRVWTPVELHQFGTLCLTNNVTIITDEIHCDLLRKGKQFTPLAKLFPESDQIITCMSVSKTFNLAGLMLANIVIPNDAIRSQWQAKNSPLDNPLSIAAAQAAYTDGSPWLEGLTVYLDANFKYVEDYLKTHLPKAKFSIPEATYLAWINVQAYFPNTENLTLFFANTAGVLLEGGHMFVANGEGYIRINLACPKAQLEIGLARIKNAILT